MTANQDDSNEADLLRTQEFDTAKPIELDIGNSAGRISVELTDTAMTHVEVRHDTASASFDWRDGVAGLLSWVSERFHEARAADGPKTPEMWAQKAAESASAAVRETEISLTGNRLVVRAPSIPPLRVIPLAIKVQAPQNSHVGLRTGSGTVTITGSAGRVNIQSGTGPVSVERATGKTMMRSGSGVLRIGSVEGELHARSGNSAIEIGSVHAPSTVSTSSGDVWLGEVDGDVLVRTGTGDVTVADAAAGQTELISGSGELQVSVRKGVFAEIDLSSTTGTASSDLAVSDDAPQAEPELRIVARTGSGNAILTSAG